MKNGKRILSVTLKRMTDESPDTSWIGEYSNVAKTEFAIDRAHSVDCPAQSDDDFTCDCGGLARGEYRYFNPGSVETFDPDARWLAKTPVGRREKEWREQMRKNAALDFARMEALNRGDFCFVGVRADAKTVLAGDVVQDITSGGIWGIESDSGDYFAEVEQEELADLKAQLKAVGFSSRQIATAFRDIKEGGDCR